MLPCDQRTASSSVIPAVGFRRVSAERNCKSDIATERQKSSWRFTAIRMKKLFSGGSSRPFSSAFDGCRIQAVGRIDDEHFVPAFERLQLEHRQNVTDLRDLDLRSRLLRR